MIHARSIALAALAIGLSAAAPGQPTPPVQTIQVFSFGYAPKPIQLAADRPVTLSFVNQSNNGHDFTAREFFAAAKIVSGAAPNGEVELKGHETKNLTLIPRAGSYQAHCSHFMHASMGMHAQIFVR